MGFRELVYSVLVVSSNEKFNETIIRLLPATDSEPVRLVTNIAAAKRALLEQTYDFVLVNAPLGDDFGTRFAVDASTGGTLVLLLVRTELHEQIHAKVVTDGVYTLPKPTSPQMLAQALGWMASGRERLRRMEKKATSIEEKMEEIRLVNRAKWLLIENLKMTEADAHRYIEKQAMDRCVPRREIAMGIVKTYC